MKRYRIRKGYAPDPDGTPGLDYHVEVKDGFFGEWRHVETYDRKRTAEAADESSKDLLRRMVQFNPMYSVTEAAKALGFTGDKVRSLIAEGKIGHVCLGGYTRGDTDVRYYRITGWQLIEFIEHLQEAGEI